MAAFFHPVPLRNRPDAIAFSFAALARAGATHAGPPLVAVWIVAADGHIACHWSAGTAPLTALAKGPWGPDHAMQMK
jgi:hypothetical protein